MKNSRLHLVILALFGLSALTVNAAQLASAKVLSVSGTVHSYAEGSKSTALTVGTILTQGDSITTTALSNALIVFSNGSEITIKENTSLTIAALSQEAFSGKKSYQQLRVDPSKSQALLELNYGKISGHVKKLSKGSEFNIATPLGTAAIRGTRFDVSLHYNAERGEFILSITNKDGKVEVISRYAGSIDYGRGSVGNIGYDHSVTGGKSAQVPPTHQIVIRLSDNDPYFDEVIDLLKNMPPFQPGKTRPSIVIEKGNIPTHTETETGNNSNGGQTISPNQPAN